jgi:hypothetical protein
MCFDHAADHERNVVERTIDQFTQHGLIAPRYETVDDLSRALPLSPPSSSGSSLAGRPERTRRWRRVSDVHRDHPTISRDARRCLATEFGLSGSREDRRWR